MAVTGEGLAQADSRDSSQQGTVPGPGLRGVQLKAGAAWAGRSARAKQDFTHSLSTQEETFRDSISFLLLKSQARS